jgi:CheY-like chemotaxis protein
VAKILVIDDDPIVLSYISTLLNAYDHSTYLAKDGNDGMKMFRSVRLDLVITDIVMPEKEGIATIREIRSFNASIPILAMSGGRRIDKSADYLNLAMALGASARLDKPFTPDELFDAVNHLLAIPPGHRQPPTSTDQGETKTRGIC